jgi:hypothetical protein
MPTNQQQEEEINRLCLAVIHEKDPAKLTKLLLALNVLLNRRTQDTEQAS